MTTELCNLVKLSKQYFLAASSGHLAGEGGEVVVAASQPNMSSIEIEACLREKVRNNFDSLRQVTTKSISMSQHKTQPILKFTYFKYTAI